MSERVRHQKALTNGRDGYDIRSYVTYRPARVALIRLGHKSRRRQGQVEMRETVAALAMRERGT